MISMPCSVNRGRGFSVNSLYYLDNLKFPLFITILFFISFFSKSFFKEKIFLAISFLCFWGIFLFFYAGSYSYGADVRYSLVSYIPMTILAGLGVYQFQSFFKNFPTLKFYVNPIIAIVIVLSFLKFLPQVRAETEEAWGARADHYYAEQFATLLPETSIVLTHNPNMFLCGEKMLLRFHWQQLVSYVNQVLFYHYIDTLAEGDSVLRRSP